MAITPPQYLLHHDGDNVAVAMEDLQPGTLHGRSVKEGTEGTAVLNHAIPLGHKFALTDLAEGDAIIKTASKSDLHQLPSKRAITFTHTT
jgi:(2R)-sulfolactate sulfo-lyase subunit alpha